MPTTVFKTFLCLLWFSSEYLAGLEGEEEGGEGEEGGEEGEEGAEEEGEEGAEEGGEETEEGEEEGGEGENDTDEEPIEGIEGFLSCGHYCLIRSFPLFLDIPTGLRHMKVLLLKMARKVTNFPAFDWLIEF